MSKLKPCPWCDNDSDLKQKNIELLKKIQELESRLKAIQDVYEQYQDIFKGESFCGAKPYVEAVKAIKKAVE